MSLRRLTPAGRRMQWPTLPKRVRCVGGPVRIRRKKGLLSDDNREAWGLWDAEHRTIWISASRFPREMQWRVLYHELMHVALSDSGLENVLPEKGVEALCDAVSSARIVERLG